jgi:hypothetical protein
MIKKAIENYVKNGYAVIPNFISAAECDNAIN